MKKIVSLVLFTAMLVSLFVFPTSAAAWNGTDISASLAGEGTAASPYLVASAADLAFLAKSVNEGTTYEGKYITQTADIDLGNKEWTPIGTKEASFKGVYDGKTKKITGLSLTNDTLTAVGLFGCIVPTEAAVAGVANVNLSGAITLANPINNGGVGGLVGLIFPSNGAAINDVYVINCVVDVDVTVTEHSAEGRVGGVVGQGFNAKLENVVNNGNITVAAKNSTRIGGLVAQSNRTAFVNCVNNGDIVVNLTTTEKKNLNVGGFVGMVRTIKTDGKEITFTNCVNNGDITGVSTSTGSLQMGGFVGDTYADDNNNAMTLKNCLNTGNISGTLPAEGNTNFPYVGGILSIAKYNLNCAIENCVNTGAIESVGGKSSRAGGIVGVMNKAGQTTVYAKGCMTTGAKWAGYVIADHDGGENVKEAEATVANTAAKKITDAIAPSEANVGGFATGYVKPVTPPPAPMGDATTLVVLLAVVSLAAVVVVKKSSTR